MIYLKSNFIARMISLLHPVDDAGNIYQHLYIIFQIGWGYQPIPYDDPFFHDLHREWKYRKMESQAQGWALRFSAQVFYW